MRRGVLPGLLALGLLIAGCARRAPQGISERYIESLQAYDYASCYALLSDKDRAERSLAEFLTEIPLAPDVTPALFRQILHQTHYEIGATRHKPGTTTAMVPVKVTAPELPLWERTLDAADPSGQASADAVQRSLDLGTFPKQVYNDSIFLVKEHHQWRIAAGFNQRDLIVEQHHRALHDDYLGERYDRAVSAWKVMIADLKAQRLTGSQGLADQYSRELTSLEEMDASEKGLRALNGKLQLREVAMKMAEQRVPGIFGVVRNDSGRPIDALSVAVTWYSGRGKDLKAVYREEHPVVITPLEFTDFERPIIPFLPGESRAFGFVASASPQIQQAAAPYVTIGAVALTNPSVPLPKIEKAGTTPPSPVQAKTAAIANEPVDDGDAN